MTRGNIYLTGFMGAGKSTVGQLLAKSMRRTFVDMDAVLEREFKMSIPEVFATVGEEEFRSRENALLKKLGNRTRLVVATGGGVPENGRNRAIMRQSGKTVYLDADLQSCMSRLNSGDRASRPLWREGRKLEELFRRRAELYAACDVRVHVDEKRPEEITNAIIARLFEDEKFSATLGEAECPVIVTCDAPAALSRFVRGRRVALITDRTVSRIHGSRFRDLLDDPVEIVVQPGERSKTLSTARRIFEKLHDQRFERDDMVVALGGGVVTDLAAFVASTYKRGMHIALVSTTLLGCVDAAVGGKTAVNLGSTKNVIGTFNIPAAVILDIFSLGTLHRKQISEGLVEAYKTGLVASPTLASLIERETRNLRSGDLQLLAEVASLSARSKAHVVAQDFREAGRRRILNFGHTFGHAVEAFHRFRISHGQSVALGMIAATRLSEARGLLSSDAAERIISTTREISPYDVAPPPPDEAWEQMRHDKKIKGGKMVFVLIEGIGQAVCVDDVSRQEVAAAFRRIEEKSDG
ncbi:MAG: 3-dehydroquinate synthase [Deltaproteobacteria bacterium]